MKENRKIKSISFDLSDEVEMQLLAYAETKKSFSVYVKRLIQADQLTGGALEDLSIIEKVKKEKKYDPKDFEIEL
ncbi:hypothetical protein JOD29_000837 [Lysinibacillus composti]|uniref:Uncharacterized protein n=1 Tax=Lysinibacillus composti TaxID=720633 RepID=A0A3N9UIL0_9BACI|nr:hypothetical protein [Lysinibacillus composti]MBM7607593.1 hypothetical protein [Lysinibacillus composti]RQW75903.1 hypothetical protein EBB45_04615 [Lysinibacillus composti]